jgi:hypothetical protein
MTLSFLFKKLKIILPVLCISIGSSCNQDKKETKTPDADTSQAKMDHTPTSTVTDTSKKSNDLAQVNGGFIDLKAPCGQLLDLFNKGKFVKFRFIRYQRSEDDDVRLFCYALDTDIRDDRDDRRFRLGNPVFISKDGMGEDPTTLDGAIITMPALALSLDEMKTIFLKTEPTSCRDLDFDYRKFTDTHGDEYDSYEVFKVGNDCKVHLNPSPPGRRQEKIVNKVNKK